MFRRNVLIVCLMFIVGSTLMGCTVSNYGSAHIDCAGFTISGLVASNTSGYDGPFTVTATDSKNKIIYSGPVGDTIPDGTSSITLTLGASWKTAPAKGSIRVKLQGKTYTGECGDNGGPIQVFHDGRINPESQATVVGYCNADHSVTIYAKVSGEWYKVATFTPQQIRDALAKAAEQKQHQLVGQASGEQLWALKSNELQLHDAMGVKYDYIFPANYCGG